MLSRINCAKCIGIEAEPVTVEVDISPGIGIHLTGMADTAIKESVIRVTTALKSSGFRIPGHRIVVNLAPADIRKSGSGFDLAIALGIIFSSGQCPEGDIKDYLVMGELGLDGSLRDIPGCLPMAQLASGLGYKGIILPKGSAYEATRIKGPDIYYAYTINDVLRILNEEIYRSAYDARRIACHEEDAAIQMPDIPDMSEISGQAAAKRALEVSAAGGHNMLMIGTPGSGKSTLAKAMLGILPPMSEEEANETGKLYSIAGLPLPPGNTRPFRSPYRSTTLTAMTGGGESLMPGEISLSNNGILFLDEAAEMPARLLNSIKEPLENGTITISRIRNKVTFPSRFILILASNPCPCGYYGEGDRCRCSAGKISSYLSRLSGPLLDRIDIKVFIPPVSGHDLTGGQRGETSEEIRRRVIVARDIQKARFGGDTCKLNGTMARNEVNLYCSPDPKDIEFCGRLIDRYRLSARGYVRMLKVARTIADLEGSENITRMHLTEAVSYRTAGEMGRL